VSSEFLKPRRVGSVTDQVWFQRTRKLLPPPLLAHRAEAPCCIRVDRVFGGHRPSNLAVGGTRVRHHHFRHKRLCRQLSRPADRIIFADRSLKLHWLRLSPRVEHRSQYSSPSPLLLEKSNEESYWESSDHQNDVVLHSTAVLIRWQNRGILWISQLVLSSRFLFFTL
jgi:hypothetical protein